MAYSQAVTFHPSVCLFADVRRGKAQVEMKLGKALWEFPTDDLQFFAFQHQELVLDTRSGEVNPCLPITYAGYHLEAQQLSHKR